MVARINTGKNISKALNYNEQKVKEGKAQMLSSSGFVKESQQMNFYDKLNHFKKVIALNERVATNSIHISLNFDRSEHLSCQKLIDIADTYMQKIGFGMQPYLVYKHVDAGHPHIHIVSTNIKRDGTRISMHNLGRNESENARKQIEKEFGLVHADRKKTQTETVTFPVNPQKVIYGKSETKRAIANVLMFVINQYKYCSIAELNAVLMQYNILVDTGRVGSRMYAGRGLVYHVLNDQGNKIGVPIKASAFYMQPTLKNLEKKFCENEILKPAQKKVLQISIDWVLRKPPDSLEKFIGDLKKENITGVLRIGKEGVIYGITYIDHNTKTVFNGSDIGKNYSAKAIQEKCHYVQPVKSDNLKAKDIFLNRKPGKQESDTINSKKEYLEYAQQSRILAAEKAPVEYVPKELKRRKKRKRKKISQ